MSVKPDFFLKPGFMIVKVKTRSHNRESVFSIFLSKLVFISFEFTVVIPVIVFSLLCIIVIVLLIG